MFFFNDTATTEIYTYLHTLSLHDALPISFNGRRLVVFSGGAAKGTEGLLEEIQQIRDGGGTGAIIGRNSFQRPREEALQLLDSIIKIYQGDRKSTRLNSSH